MDLIIWRHAEAEPLVDNENDLARELTKKGRRQAAHMADWLDRRLPESTRILVSPAKRAEQTAMALGKKYKLRDDLNPQASAADVLALLSWDLESGPARKGPILLVGHQPWIGQLISLLLKVPEEQCSVRKGSIWWMRTRSLEKGHQTYLWTVLPPELT